MASKDPYFEESPHAGIGWVLFSAIVLGFAGFFAFLEGILAIGNSRVYAGHGSFVFSNLRTWGVIVMILGILAMYAAFALFRGSEFARWFGISIAALHALGQLLFHHANSSWSVALFAIDILVIYGLAVHGGAKARID
jgi:hypothetical protein